MFSEEDYNKVIEDNQITRTVAEKLLNIYVGETDWWKHIERLFRRLEKQHDRQKAAEEVKKAISFIIMLPATDKNAKLDKDTPENNLFWGMKYDQFNDKDWFKELQDVIRKDHRITEYRKKLLSLGVIDPIDYQPMCRQAYKWLCGEAETSGVELTQDRKNKFRQLVMAYGGAVICYIFENHRPALKKIVNWRTGYFFERLIFEVYTLDQVLKIKKAELDKTNPKWIKRIR